MLKVVMPMTCWNSEVATLLEVKAYQLWLSMTLLNSAGFKGFTSCRANNDLRVFRADALACCWSRMEEKGRQLPAAGRECTWSGFGVAAAAWSELWG